MTSPIPLTKTVSGFMFVVRTESGQEFPYVPSFGITVDDAIKRMRNAHQRTHRPQSKRPVALIKCEVTTLARVEAGVHTRWDTITDKQFAALSR